MTMHVARVQTSTADPFLSEELFDRLRVDPSQHSEVFQLARAAAGMIEGHGNLALLNQVVRVTWVGWERDVGLPLPVGPVKAGADITILVDAAPLTDFILLPGDRPTLLFTAPVPEGTILIDYTCGFGATAEDVPPELRLAIIDQAAAFFDARGAGDGKTLHLSPHAARIVARYRRVGL